MVVLSVHVHALPPLYVQVQVPPLHVAAHTLPRESWHEYMSVVGRPPPPLPLPEHVAVPTGGGIEGHWLVVSEQPNPPTEGRLRFTQSETAFCCASQPGNTGSPAWVHVGVTPCAQRR
jgi:hypothetical protein